MAPFRVMPWPVTARPIISCSATHLPKTHFMSHRVRSSPRPCDMLPLFIAIKPVSVHRDRHARNPPPSTDRERTSSLDLSCHIVVCHVVTGHAPSCRIFRIVCLSRSASCGPVSCHVMPFLARHIISCSATPWSKNHVMSCEILSMPM